jgi:hypothetical protein
MPLLNAAQLVGVEKRTGVIGVELDAGIFEIVPTLRIHLDICGRQPPQRRIRTIFLVGTFVDAHAPSLAAAVFALWTNTMEAIGVVRLQQIGWHDLSTAGKCSSNAMAD